MGAYLFISNSVIALTIPPSPIMRSQIHLQEKVAAAHHLLIIHTYLFHDTIHYVSTLPDQPGPSRAVNNGQKDSVLYSQKGED